MIVRSNGWMRWTDDQSGKFYFQEEATGKTQWEEPSGWTLSANDDASDGGHNKNIDEREEDEEDKEEEEENAPTQNERTVRTREERERREREERQELDLLQQQQQQQQRQQQQQHTHTQGQQWRACCWTPVRT